MKFLILIIITLPYVGAMAADKDLILQPRQKIDGKVRKLRSRVGNNFDIYTGTLRHTDNCISGYVLSNPFAVAEAPVFELCVSPLSYEVARKWSKNIDKTVIITGTFNSGLFEVESFLE